MENCDVVVEIDGVSFYCAKEELIKESSYFEAMFKSDFVEKNKNHIELKVILFLHLKLSLLVKLAIFYKNYMSWCLVVAAGRFSLLHSREVAFIINFSLLKKLSIQNPYLPILH